MTREIYVPLGDTGNTKLYFRRRNTAGQYWRGDTLSYEDYNASNIAIYGADTESDTPYNTLIEDGNTGDYFGSDPTSGAGTWTAYEQEGETPAETDIAIANGQFVDPQTIRDAMKLTPTTGIAENDSIDAKLDLINTKLDGTFDVNVVSVDGIGIELADIKQDMADAIAADKTGYKLAADGLDEIADEDMAPELILIAIRRMLENIEIRPKTTILGPCKRQVKNMPQKI